MDRTEASTPTRDLYDHDDTVSEMSGGQGTLTTAGTIKENQAAHELRLNLIYSGTYLLGMMFLCLHDLLFFLYYPAIIFLVLHCVLELRHDIVHKTRYYAHSRYTQATQNDRSYGGDLYIANLAQSWSVMWGMSLLLLSNIMRVKNMSFNAYKSTYFAASFFFFISGATTMLSRGCGSFYFLGSSPGFSVRDQAANFIYVTSTVMLLILASWQIDHGAFDAPLKFFETLIFWMWLVAAAHYTAADVNRLTKDKSGNDEGVSDAMRMAANDEEYASKYVQMREGPSKVRSTMANRRFDRVESARTPQTMSDSTPRTISDVTPQAGMMTRDTSLAQTLNSTIQTSGGRSLESDLRPTASLLSGSTTGDYSRGQATVSTAHTTDTPSVMPSVTSLSRKSKSWRPRSWQSRLGFGSDMNCGVDTTMMPTCTPIVLDPAGGPPREIPGRDGLTDSPPLVDSVHDSSTRPTATVPDSGPPKAASTPEKEGAITSSTRRVVTPPPMIVTPNKGNKEATSKEPGQLNRAISLKKKKSKKMTTKFWGGNEIV